MDIPLGLFVIVQRIQDLTIRQGAKGHNVQDLSLAAAEQSTAMYAGQQINLGMKRTDLGHLTAVGTFAVDFYHLADGLLLILVDTFVDIGEHGLLLFFRQGRNISFQIFRNLGDTLVAHHFVVCENDLFHLLRRAYLL